MSKTDQFDLHTLLTEQRHPKTWNLSSAIREDALSGLKMLLSVDEDITDKINELAHSPAGLDLAVDAVCQAITHRQKIYFYGCGATGRLAKQMESTFWRPFWKSLKGSGLWGKIRTAFPDDIEEKLIGEMTGADRALISSLEGFEDIQIIGKLQLHDRHIQKGDIIFCVTEGGETSSVIGTILEALSQYGEMNEQTIQEARRNLFFIYNNPDELLLPFDRSRKVIENPGITKINLTTGPQAISGSTRMQATTIESFVLGAVLEEAICRILKNLLTKEELAGIGFDPDLSLPDRLLSFAGVKAAVDQSAESMVKLLALEAKTYGKGCRTTYFAKEAMVTVFIDSTERSPTFRLFPLDTVDQEERKSWIQIWTEGSGRKEAWYSFLGRGFRGMDEKKYKPSFLTEIEYPRLREAALKSLGNAGNDQEMLYDFSFAEFNIRQRGPARGDLGVVVCFESENREWLNHGSSFNRFARLFRENDAGLAVITVTREPNAVSAGLAIADVHVNIVLPAFPDPLGMRKQMAAKMMLNAHSTAVMAYLGRVVGNTMTCVNPGNLKLLGRAARLIMNHVNETLLSDNWTAKYGNTLCVSYQKSYETLLEVMDYLIAKNQAHTAEVALSVIRLLEGFKTGTSISSDAALAILNNQGLENYLREI